MTEAMMSLLILKEFAKAQGYYFVTDVYGTERMHRPDGTVAIVAKPQRPPVVHRRHDEAPLGEIPATLCEHANECPSVCPCPPNCYCRRVGSAPACKPR